MGRERTWTDEQLTEAVKGNHTFSNALRQLGLSTSGGHFYQVKRHIDRLGLDTSHWHSIKVKYDEELIRTEISKRCSICKRFKPFEEFFKANSSKDGFSSWCKPCKRERQRSQQWLKSHGLTLAEYEERLEQQDGRCAICWKEPNGGRWDRLYVDHRHSDNTPRGLLCSTCNLALGKFGDDPVTLERAAAYLRSW